MLTALSPRRLVLRRIIATATNYLESATKPLVLPFPAHPLDRSATDSAAMRLTCSCGCLLFSPAAMTPAQRTRCAVPPSAALRSAIAVALEGRWGRHECRESVLEPRH